MIQYKNVLKLKKDNTVHSFISTNVVKHYIRSCNELKIEKLIPILKS